MNFSLKNLLNKYDTHLKIAGVVMASVAAGFYSASQHSHQLASVEMEKKMAIVALCESAENQELDICVEFHESVKKTVATIEWDWQDGREHDAR